MNSIQLKDLEEFANDFTLYKSFSNKTFLITGATGLIGSSIVHCLSSLNKKYALNIKILCPVRNLDKAKSIFEDIDSILFKQKTIDNFLMDYSERHIDYIIHCASPTASKFMLTNPVETYSFTIESTLSLLHYSKKHGIESMVYVSSLEYYGQYFTEETITEDKIGYVNPTSPRSSYPLGKRAAEYACKAYSLEYNIPVKVARLTQTFGAGISKDDNRVFAQFAKAAINNEDIVLKSSGNSSKPYCYTTDTVSGILTMLLRGKDGEAYNVSNDKTYISINDMARLVKNNFNNKINIIHDIDPNSGYAPDTLLKLSSQKLQELGWKPKYDLVEMYTRLIAYLKSKQIS